MILACGLCLFAAAGDDGGAVKERPAAGQPKPPPGAVSYLIRVPIPIAGEVDTRLKAMIGELLERWKDAGERPTLVLEFGGGDEGVQRASQFERALSLARFLASEKLSRVRTVAYLTGPVHGHAVLPVLACEQIIAHPDAEFGRAGLAEDALDPTVRSGYVEIAERRRTIPTPVVLGMLDPQLSVSRVQTQDGTRFVLSDELNELQKQSAVRSVEQVIPAGQLGNFTGTELRVKYDLATPPGPGSAAAGLGPAVARRQSGGRSDAGRGPPGGPRGLGRPHQARHGELGRTRHSRKDRPGAGQLSSAW